MDKALKQRLVGASVLIILAVIVLPMLLSGRSDTLKQESRQIELPPKPEELSFETRRFPIEVPNQTAQETEKASDDPPKDQTDSETRGPVASAQPLILDNADATAVQPDDTPPSVPDIENTLPQQGETQILDTPRYLVQVASFSNEKSANALADSLRADNVPVVMDVVDRVAGRLHRVRVGPFVERSDADAVVSRLNSQIKDLNPRVLDLRPNDSAPVSTPSDPLVRWVVQVGSFRSAANAESLVARLRLAGLTVFSEKVSSAQGIVYKVRLGPEIDRDKATELARMVKTEHGLDGLVMTLD